MSKIGRESIVTITVCLLMVTMIGCGAPSQPNNLVDLQHPDIMEEEAADQGFSPLDSDWSELDTSQIESVSLYPYRTTDEPVVLSEEEVSQLVDSLKNVKLIGEGTQDFLNYDGLHNKLFYIQLTSGTTFDFAASSPFFIIDGELGFSAEYAVSNEIWEFYVALLEKYYDLN